MTEAKRWAVALERQPGVGYPEAPPFHPSAEYPELPEPLRIAARGASLNRVYDAVRNALRLLRLDEAHLGGDDWNPLRDYVRPGSNVVIKPNFVSHETGALVGSNCLTTHGSVIRAVVDYVYLALGGSGRITIADAPIQSARFDRIINRSGIREICRFYRDRVRFDIDVLDLRQTIAIKDDAIGLILEQRQAAGDPRGYVTFDLGNQSAFECGDGPKIDPTRFGVTDYSAADTRARHAAGRHEYVVSRTILEADTLIAVPKLKVHEKVGLTVCLKGMVGVIGSKDCLPHFRAGSPQQNGDEFTDDGRFLASAWTFVRSRAQRYAPVPVWRSLRATGKLAARLTLRFKHRLSSRRGAPLVKPIVGGAWYGNDTAWRMVVDLNRIVRNGTIRGTVEDSQQRRFFAVVDGITAGEGQGPLAPTPKRVGTIIAADNAWAADRICAALIGFDPQSLRILQQSVWLGDLPLMQAERSLDLRSNDSHFASLDGLRREAVCLTPPPGWVGRVEDRHTTGPRIDAGRFEAPKLA